MPSALAALVLLGYLVALAPSFASAATKKDAQVHIRFWNCFYWGGPADAVELLVERFNEQHPAIYVDKLDVPQIEQKLFTATAGNVPPEVALFDRFRVAGYAERRAFLELDDLAAQHNIRKEEFFDTCWGECVYRDKLYAIPFNTDVRVLFYNRAVFREVGLDPDRPPRTWKELLEYSKKVTVKNPDGSLDRIGFVPMSGVPGGMGNTWLYLYGWQNGGQFMNEDGTFVTCNDPKIIEALQWCVDFVDFYGIGNLQQFASGFGIKELDPFLTGKAALVGDEGFQLARIRQYKPDLDFGVAPLPWPEDGVHATWSGGFALVVPSGCEHVDAAMEFIRFLTEEQQQADYGETSEQIPANRLASQAPYFSEDPDWRVFVEEMAYSRYRPVSAIGNILWDELFRAVEMAVNHQKSPQQALDGAQRAAQKELNQVLTTRTEPLLPWTPVTAGLLLAFFAFAGWRAWHSYSRIRKMTLRRKEAVSGYLFALPVMIGLLCFTLGPIVVSAIYSLCFYEVLTPARWVGVQNYQRLFAEDPRFWHSLWNTIFYTVLSVPLGVAGSLGVALLLNAKIVGRSFMRTLFYLPSIVPIVAASMLFLWLFNGEFGLFNAILRGLGLPPAPWISSPAWSKPSLVLMSLWGVGGGMIIFLAGLQGIPKQLYEAARIDGAGPFQQFLNVTLPMLSPTIFFLMIINTIAAFQIFTQAFLMTNGQGTPLDSTLFYVFYLYRLGFEYFQMGLASAMAWILFIVIIAITALQFKYSSRWVHAETVE